MNKKYLIIFFIVLALLLASAIFFRCSFNPIWRKELPAECNMTLNCYRFYNKVEDKSGTVLMTEACKNKLKRIDCQIQVFGKDDKGSPLPFDIEDKAKMSEYYRCLNEK
jgi:hypothetical protein